MLGLAAVATPDAVAQTTGTTNQQVTYDLDFATDFNLLLNPNDPVAQHFAMWKTPAQLASLRSAPMIRLTNRSDSTLNITELRLDMGRQTFQFDSFAFLEQPNNGPAAVTSHTDMTFGGDMKNFMVINFPQGLAPGDSFTFQVRLANMNGPGLANYEDVLWDKTNALFSPNRTNNALVTVKAGGGANTVVNMTPVRLFEYPLGNANFPSTAQPDTNGSSGFSTVLPGGHEMEIVGMVRFSQTTNVAVIPEPSTVTSMSIALVALAGYRLRRRRAA